MTTGSRGDSDGGVNGRREGRGTFPLRYFGNALVDRYAPRSGGAPRSGAAGRPVPAAARTAPAAASAIVAPVVARAVSTEPRPPAIPPSPAGARRAGRGASRVLCPAAASRSSSRIAARLVPGRLVAGAVLAGAVSVAGVTFVPAPPAVAAGAPQEPLDSARYLGLLGETRGGLFITSGRALAGYRAESAGEVVRDFLASEPGPLLLKTAALLHTEAAGLSRSGAETHFDLARSLLRALPDPADREDWLRRWWLAVCSSYQVSLNSAAVVAAFERALADLPGDRALREAQARTLQMIGRQREEEPYQAMAAAVLEEMLRETPEDAALRVRRAGVLVDLGRETEAGAELDRAAEGRLRAMDRFALFLLRGEIALGAGDFAAAETAFAEALRRGRRSPSAVSGLVAARLGRGDRAGAAAAARGLLDRRPGAWEPEWRYWLGAALEYRQMFDALKAEVRATATAEPGGARR